MESWQKTYITEHLPRFIEETTVNAEIIAFLKADKILGNADVQKLEADTGGNMAKAKVLYDQLFTRTNGYKAIGRATFESKQSGAFLLLLNGLVKRLLRQCNIDLDEETVDEILKAECLTDDVWHFFSAKVDKGTLYENTWIAALRPFYIPRHISNRIKLTPEVFKQNCADVFVLSGITRPALTKLAEPSPTAVSSQVIKFKMTTIKFVLLEHEHHWDMLRSVLSVNPIHWIVFDSHSNDYILQNSTRSSEVVSNHVAPHLRDKSLYVHEEQFLAQISNEGDQRTICICDTPGMGKTWLLENLARQNQQRDTSRMVAVIGLQNFVEKTWASPQHSINFDKSFKFLLDYLCPFRLTSTILERALENNGTQLDLFLDGFDEVPKVHVQTTRKFIKAVAKNRPNVKLFITSRPHMRAELERTFKGVAYDILPFSDENQAEFLVRFWQQFAKRPKDLNSEKLKLFAEECLTCLKKSLTKEESNMMGIPLQCLLLATVNLTNAELYCHRDNTLDVTEFISPTSLYDIYTIYFEMGIDRTVRSKANFNYDSLWTPRKLSPRSGGQERQMLKAFHIWVALQQLMPDFAEDYRQREGIPDFESERVLACGILQASSSDKTSPTAMTFIHRTFAEYLVAEHFAEIITTSYKSMNNKILKKYIRYFVDDILSTQPHYSEILDFKFRIPIKYAALEFSNSAIVYFLNGNLQSKTETSSSNLVSQNLLRFLSSKNFSSILNACTTCSYADIIRLFKNLLKPFASKISSEDHTFRGLVVCPTLLGRSVAGYPPYQYDLSVCGYLCHAAYNSNVRVLDELYGLFEECLHENLKGFCSSWPKDFVTPLHYAIERVDYSLVEYFASQFTLSGRQLLFSFPKDGYYDNQNAEEICELLFRNDASIIFEKIEGEDCNTDEIIFHVRSVKLIKFLVQLGADVRATRIHTDDECRVDTVLTINASRMHVSEFCELCQYLIHEINAFDLFTPNLPFWDDPLQRLIYWIDDDTLTSILEIPGTKLDSNDDEKNNLILASIAGNRKLRIVKSLVNLGVDVFAKNIKGNNALHLAVKSGNLDTTKYLLALGFNSEEKDYWQNTALHHADGNIDMLKFLISKNANILAVNLEGENIAHRALASNHETDKKAVVLYLMSLKEGIELFKMTNKLGRTPLHGWIARYLNLDSETVELILQTSGEDVNATDSYGWTMFLYAAKKENSVACLECLMKFGANPNVTDEFGRSALHHLEARGSVESTKFLVSIGMSPELQGNQNNTTLLQTARYLKKHDFPYMK